MATNATATDGFDLNEDRSYVTIVLVSVLVPLATFIVGLRFYSRGILTHNLGIDDWMSGWSLIMTIITGALMGLEARTGMGRHKASLSDEEYKQYLKVFYVDVIFYIGGLAFIKLHVLLQYFRLFSVKMRRITMWVTVISCIWGLASTLAVIFVCWPIPAFWDHDVPGVCIPLEPQWYVNAAGNILTDLVIFALPIPVLWRLKLEPVQRISLICVFGLGFFTCCISIVRISFLHLVEEDETFRNTETSGWTIGEMTLAMIVSCIPTLRPILVALFPGIVSSRQESSGVPMPSLKTYAGGYIRNPRHTGSQNADRLSGPRRGSSTVELTKLDDLELGRGTNHSSAQSDADSQSPTHTHNTNDTQKDAFLGLVVGTETTVNTTSGTRSVGPPSLLPREGEIHIKRDFTLNSVRANP